MCGEPLSRSSGEQRRLALAGALLLCPAIALVSQQEQQSQPSSISFSAARVESIIAEGRERTRLTGGAVVESDDVRVVAEEIEIIGMNNRYVVGRGRVQVDDLESDIYLECNELFLDREDDYIRATGNAYMEDRANEVVVKGERIESWDEEDLTIITVNVRILGSDYTARGQLARYRREAETLELSGLPRVVWKGDNYEASRIIIDLAADEIELIGDVRATIRESQEEAGEEASDGVPSESEAAEAGELESTDG